MRASGLLDMKPPWGDSFDMTDSSFFDGRGTGNALALSTSHCSLQRGFWQTFWSVKTLINSIASAFYQFGTAASLDHLTESHFRTQTRLWPKVNAIALSSEFHGKVTELQTDHTGMVTLWHQSRNTLQRED
jgi:hypothetical protein